MYRDTVSQILETGYLREEDGRQGSLVMWKSFYITYELKQGLKSKTQKHYLVWCPNPLPPPSPKKDMTKLNSSEENIKRALKGAGEIVQ